MKRHKRARSALILLLIVCMTGCSVENVSIKRRELSDSELIGRVSGLVESQKGIISSYLDIDPALLDEDPDTIVARALEEENGRAYIEFCAAVEDADDASGVLQKARGLVDARTYAEIEQQARELEEELQGVAAEAAKGLPVAQQEKFFADVKKLAVKSIVLMTAGIVYCFMPEVMLWGKVAAAAGISIAAGATAVTVLSIYEHYKFGRSGDESFKQWLQEVITLPQAEYAIATTVITMGTTLKQGPVVTGIVLCVYAIYQAIDILKPMLETYNLNV